MLYTEYQPFCSGPSVSYIVMIRPNKLPFLILESYLAKTAASGSPDMHFP